MKLLVTIFFICIVSTCFAQSKTNWGFMDGVIYLKNADSLIGLVEKQLVYGETLAFKQSNNSELKEIPNSQVSYFIADNKVFESVPLNGRFIMMHRIDSGKMKLYEFNEVVYGEEKYDRSLGRKAKNGTVLIHYVVNKSGVIQEIKEPSFKVLLPQIFSDCQRMAGKVSRGDYLFEDMPQIVQEYNNCKGAYCAHSQQTAIE